MVSFKVDWLESLPEVDLLTWTFGNKSYDQEKPIYIDVANPTRTLSASQVRSTVRKLIAGFKAIGVQRGDAVCIHSFSDIFYPLLYLGIIGAGGCFTGTNPGYTSYEMNHHVKTSGAKFIITEPHMLQTVLESAAASNIPDSHIYVFDAVDHHPYDGFKSWEYLLQHGESDWLRLEPDEVRTTVAQLLFTSGTTGLPKAAMLPHSYTVFQSWVLRTPPKKNYEVKRLLSLPPFHAFVIPFLTSVTLRDGCPAFVTRRFEVQQFCEAIQKFGITETCMVPPMMIAVLNSPFAHKEFLGTMRWIQAGGAPLRKNVIQHMQAFLNEDAKISQVWGMTEGGYTTAFIWPEKDETGSVGRVLPTMHVKLVDEYNNTIEKDDEQGEMCFKGPCMMLGYLGNPKDTAATFDDDGWIHTGDIGYRIDGKYYCVDRKKELIKVRGWQVAPAELESVLISHPDIVDAAVIGVPATDDSGEFPRAYIVKRKPVLTYNNASAETEVVDKGGANELTEEDIRAYMRTKLSRFKALDGGVRFTEKIPKSVSGKILKRLLREQYAAEREGGPML